MKKILFVCNGLIGGGAEKLLNDLLPIIKSRFSCDLFIFSDYNSKYHDSLLKKGINIYSCPNNSGLFKKTRYLRKRIKQGEYDLIHANLFPAFYICVFATLFLKNKKHKMLLTEHNTTNRRRDHLVLRPFERWIYSKYYYVVSISEATKASLLKWIRPKKDLDKYIVIPNGIDISSFANSKPYPKEIVFSNIKNSDILICLVGSLTEQKNIFMAIDILHYLPSNYKLVIIGEGELEYELKKYSDELHVSNRISFLGFRKDVSRLLKTCDIALITSKWEGFGLVAVEIMACGIPLVCSNVPGLSDVVDNAAIKCDLDVHAFSEAIISLNDKKTWRFLSEEEKKRAALFDIKNTAKQYISLFENILEIDSND